MQMGAETVRRVAKKAVRAADRLIEQKRKMESGRSSLIHWVLVRKARRGAGFDDLASALHMLDEDLFRQRAVEYRHRRGHHDRRIRRVVSRPLAIAARSVLTSRTARCQNCSMSAGWPTSAAGARRR